MTYYLVKKTIKATDDNPNFAGESRVYFIGKGGSCLHDPDSYDYKEYGYKSANRAINCMNRDDEMDKQINFKYYWKTEKRELTSKEIEEQ